MAVYSEILAGTDASPAGDQAVRVAATLSEGLDIPMTVINAWTESGPDAYLGATTVTTAAQRLAAECGARGVRRLEPAATGTPADTLIDLTDASPDSLLVVGDRGVDSDGERLGGNTAHHLAHHVPVDLLLAVAGRESTLARIALTTDGSMTATRGVYRGVELCGALGVVPVILTVARTQDEGEAALVVVVEDLARRDIEVRTEIIVRSGLGATAAALIEAGTDYDLLVIGNRGMSGPSRLLGSVANRVTHSASTNLLLVGTVV